MNRDKVYLKGHVVGHAADTLSYQGLMVQLENLDIVEIDKNLVHKEIGEPQKPIVPQFVADWIKYCKFTNVDLYHALEMGDLHFYNYANQEDDLKLKEFLETEKNQEIFARAWLDGYEVEKEKQYEVILCNGQSLKTVYRQGNDRLDFEKVYGDLERFTRKQLEDAGFGWVFDCEGMEVKEVEK